MRRRPVHRRVPVEVQLVTVGRPPQACSSSVVSRRRTTQVEAAEPGHDQDAEHTGDAGPEPVVVEVLAA